jgi:hypothetical protein
VQLSALIEDRSSIAVTSQSRKGGAKVPSPRPSLRGLARWTDGLGISLEDDPQVGQSADGRQAGPVR